MFGWEMWRCNLEDDVVKQAPRHIAATSAILLKYQRTLSIRKTGARSAKPNRRSNSGT